MSESNTIAAISTAPGRGGVAVVRVSGPDAFEIAGAMTGRIVSESDAGRFFFTKFVMPGGSEFIDHGLLLVFASPKSYTGENVVEFQTHGGSVTPRRILEASIASGARLARPGEFTLRAFMSGRLDLTEAEAVIDLVDAKTDRAAADAVKRICGIHRESFEKLYKESLELSSGLEHALDFDENELPENYFAVLSDRLSCLEKKIKNATATAREGRILREGALVVIVGRPNAGKSSLLNALLGENRAIVSDEEGTTRDSIEESLDLDGWPVRITDTAGLRIDALGVEAEGVSRAKLLADKADVILEIIDGLSPTKPIFDDDPRSLVFFSKADLVRTQAGENASYVSSFTGAGLADLRTAIAKRISAIAARGDDSSGADITTRQRELLIDASGALSRATTALALPEIVVASNEVRSAADALGRLIGRVYSDDLLDSIFSRFCVGK